MAANTTTSPTNSSRRLTWVTSGILALGLGSAITIYVIASSRPDNPLGYEPLETKQYRHDLEMYGGKANILAAEFSDWFQSLWYGKRLAVTIAILTLLLVFVVRFFAPAVSSHSSDTSERHSSPRSPEA
jgi:hypothetical protein